MKALKRNPEGNKQGKIQGINRKTEKKEENFPVKNKKKCHRRGSQRYFRRPGWVPELRGPDQRRTGAIKERRKKK